MDLLSSVRRSLLEVATGARQLPTRTVVQALLRPAFLQPRPRRLRRLVSQRPSSGCPGRRRLARRGVVADDLARPDPWRRSSRAPTDSELLRRPRDNTGAHPVALLERRPRHRPAARRPAADLESAVRTVVFVAAGTAGQRCSTVRRLRPAASMGSSGPPEACGVADLRTEAAVSRVVDQTQVPYVLGLENGPSSPPTTTTRGRRTWQTASWPEFHLAQKGSAQSPTHTATIGSPTAETLSYRDFTRSVELVGSPRRRSHLAVPGVHTSGESLVVCDALQQSRQGFVLLCAQRLGDLSIVQLRGRL